MNAHLERAAVAANVAETHCIIAAGGGGWSAVMLAAMRLTEALVALEAAWNESQATLPARDRITLADAVAGELALQRAFALLAGQRLAGENACPTEVK